LSLFYSWVSGDLVLTSRCFSRFSPPVDAYCFVWMQLSAASLSQQSMADMLSTDPPPTSIIRSAHLYLLALVCGLLGVDSRLRFVGRHLKHIQWALQLLFSFST